MNNDRDCFQAYQNCQLGVDDFPFGPTPPLVGNKAPDFVSSAVMPDNSIKKNFSLSEYFKGSYGLIFFYPADFTFVCPSEIIAHNNRIEEFNKRNVKIVGISVDSEHAHLAWKKIPTHEGGVGDLQFPLIADSNKTISNSYRTTNINGVALRATFLVDKDGIIRHQLVNDLPIGRNVEETLRIVDALKFVEKNNQVCPANWSEEKDAMTPSTEGVAEYLAKNANTI